MRCALSNWDLPLSGGRLTYSAGLEGPGRGGGGAGVGGGGWLQESGPGGEEGGEDRPRPALAGCGPGRPLLVTTGSKACRRAGSPAHRMPTSPFCTSVPVTPSPSSAQDLFLGFTSAKAELKLAFLREPFPIQATQL